LHWAFGICEEVSEREKFPSRLGTYSATGNREQKFDDFTVDGPGEILQPPKGWLKHVETL